jgi:hypothetical protein
MSDDADALALIPRSVRDKLDRVGIKLHLKEWERLTLDERRGLVTAPCEAPADVERYRSALSALIRHRTGHEPELLTR